MTNPTSTPRSALPHHRLVAYCVAVELLGLVRGVQIKDAHLRDQALRAAKSVCLNIAEACGRATQADKARAFVIARGEAIEAVAAVEIAELAGDAASGSAAQCIRVGERLVGLLTGLVRPR